MVVSNLRGKPSIDLDCLSSSSNLDLLPLSPAQLPVWYSEAFGPRTPRWTLVTASFLFGEVDTEKLTEASHRAEREFAALRIRLLRQGRRAYQVFAQPSDTSVRVYDFSDGPHETRIARRDAVLEAERLYVYQLYEHPLHAIVIIKLGPSEHVVALCEHHTCIDAAGVASVLRFIADVYNGSETDFQKNRSYEDWLERRSTPERIPNFSQALEYFKTSLAGAALQHDAIYDCSSDEDKETVYIPPHVTDLSRVLVPGQVEQLRQLRSRCGCSLFVIFLAAYAQTLARLVSSPDVTIGVVVSGRVDEPADIVGMCINTVMLRLDLSGNEEPEELIRLCNAAWSSAKRFQNVPVLWLSQAAELGQIPGRAQFVINMLDMKNTQLPIKGVDQHVRYITNAYPVGDLIFSPTGFEDGSLDMRLIVGTPRISERAASEIQEHVERLLMNWSNIV
jgi:hypothetical protein